MQTRIFGLYFHDDLEVIRVGIDFMLHEEGDLRRGRVGIVGSVEQNHGYDAKEKCAHVWIYCLVFYNKINWNI